MKPTVPTSNSHFEQPAALARAVKSGLVWGAIILAAVASVPEISLADEGGVSFWIPGLFGSLAATPQQPGWSLTNIDLYEEPDVKSANGEPVVTRVLTIMLVEEY
jgi:hypothetical protein